MSRLAIIALRLAPLFLVAAGMGALVAAAPNFPGSQIYLGVGADKFAHAVCSGVLFLAALPMMRFFMQTSSFASRVLTTGLLLVAAGGLLELYQVTRPTRTAAWADVAANVVGIAIAAIACFAGRAAWRALSRRPDARSPAVCQARSLLGPLSTRFVEASWLPGDGLEGDRNGWMDRRATLVIPDDPGRSSSQRAEHPGRSAPAAPAASLEDPRVALLAPHCGGPARRRLAAALPKRSPGTGSDDALSRQGLRRRRSRGQLGSRRGAGIRTRPYCRAPRHLR